MCQICDACQPSPVNFKNIIKIRYDLCIIQCLNHGVCESDGMGGFSCKCPPGFTGRTCDFRKFFKNIKFLGKNYFLAVMNQPNNPCQPNSCKNGGQCSPVGNEFICICPPEFTGLVCESSSVSNSNCLYLGIL